MTNTNFNHDKDTDDTQLAHLGNVVKSNQFRFAAIATVVGGVLARSSTSPLMKAAGVAAMLFGGFKVMDAFDEEGDK